MRRFRAIVLLQPTSPLTVPDDLVAAIERFDAAGGAGVVSVPARASGDVAYQVDEDDRCSRSPRTTRSALLTGAFYVADPIGLDRTRRFIEPGVTIGLPVPLNASVDIDEPIDLV